MIEITIKRLILFKIGLFKKKIYKNYHKLTECFKNHQNNNFKLESSN